MRTLLIPLLAALAPAAPAASFDCAKAKTRIEKTICADKALSALDEKLAAAYRERLKSWQGKIEPYVRADQRKWLEKVRAAEKPPGEVEPECRPKEPLAACLTRLYSERVGVLEGQAYALSGVYRRDKSGKLLLWPGAGAKFQVYVLVRDGPMRRTADRAADAAGFHASDQLSTKLGDGNALLDPKDPCELRLQFLDLSVQVKQTGKCSGANYAGTYRRDLKDLLANYENSIDLD